MKLGEEMNSRAIGAELLVDQDNTPKPVTLPEMTCSECHGTGKAEVVNDSVKREIEDAIRPIINELNVVIGARVSCINDIAMQVFDIIAKRDEAHKKQVDSLFRDIRALEKESWERGEDLSCAKEHLNNTEKRIAELEAALSCALLEATSLAKALHRRYYRDVAPKFELSGSVAAVISQIDNMAAGLLQRIAEIEAEIAKLKQPSEELKSLFDSALPHMSEDKNGLPFWTPAERSQVIRLGELLRSVASRENAFKGEIAQLKADKAELVEALEHIAEYWNRDRNDGAMHDALWHIINTADELIAKHTEVNK